MLKRIYELSWTEKYRILEMLSKYPWVCVLIHQRVFYAPILKLHKIKLYILIRIITLRSFYLILVLNPLNSHIVITIVSMFKMTRSTTLRIIYTRRQRRTYCFGNSCYRLINIQWKPSRVSPFGLSFEMLLFSVFVSFIQNLYKF